MRDKKENRYCWAGHGRSLIHVRSQRTSVRNEGLSISRSSIFICIGPILILSREKIIKLDAKNRQYDIVVIGEEPHVAYNRVGLTSFFEHREVEQLYLNPKEWVSENEHKHFFF